MLPIEVEKKENDEKESNSYTALLFMLLGSVSMGSMNVAVKYVSSETEVTVM